MFLIKGLNVCKPDCRRHDDAAKIGLKRLKGGLGLTKGPTRTRVLAKNERLYHYFPRHH